MEATISDDDGTSYTSGGSSGITKSRYVDPAGGTIEKRFKTPDGFVRVAVPLGSFAEYLRGPPLKPDGSPVLYFDGRTKANYGVYEAVVAVDVGPRDLQQCADAVMRLRAEYLFKNGRFDEIVFYFANGFKADFKTWMEGYRIVVEDNRSRWVKSAVPSGAYQDFRKYLDMVFAYANTVSLAKQMVPVEISKMTIGDVLIDQGHAVIVVDMAENRSTGEKVFMIAQSYMPAQDIQVLKNPNDLHLSPWYSLDCGETLRTPEWTFTRKDLRRFR